MGAARSLRSQILLLALALAAVPLLLGLVGLAFSLRYVREGVSARNLQLAEAVAGEVGRFLDAQVVHLKGIGQGDGLDGGPATLDFQAHAEAHLAVNPALRAVAVLDGRGRVLRMAPPDRDVLGTDLSAQPFVREARARRLPTWSSATFSPQLGQPVVSLVVPGSAASLVGYFDLRWLVGIVGRHAGDEGEALVVDGDGTVVGARDQALVREQVNVRDLPPVRAALGGTSGTEELTFRGRWLLGSAAGVAQAGWTVLVVEPVDKAYGRAYRAWGGMSLVLALCLFAVALVGLRRARDLLRPIDALAAATRRLAAGDAPGQLLVDQHRGFSEIADLARSFDAMAAAVRKREEELARSERSYRRMVSTPLAGVIRTTLAGRMVFCNEAFARLVGCKSTEEALAHSALDFYKDPAARAYMLQLVSEAGRAANLEVTFRAVDGREREVLLNVVRDEEDTLSTVVLDVTEMKRAALDRERLEQQLLHSQKVEAVGRFAGGIAHDFNNLLTAIIAHTELLEDELPPGGGQRESLDGINDAVTRATRLTRSLLAFSRKQILQRTSCDLRDVVGRVEALLRSLIGEDVEFRVELPAAPLVSQIDAGQIEQVLVNLCTNARDAMPRGGTLTLSAAAAVLGDAEAAGHGLARGGPFVRVSVRDTGEGMPPEVRARVFEPFFTTKEVGKGTGLGLAIVHGIVRQHYGAVEVESAPGQGSTFHVLLPADPSGAIVEAQAGERARPPGGSETLLLAEDEALLRAALKTVLTRAGYQVLEAADGKQAVDAFLEHRGRIALCIIDVMMPAMNGRAALEAIQRVQPGARVLLASGYSADVLETRGVSTLGAELIAKPIQPHELLRRIRAMLDAPEAAVSAPAPPPT